MDFVEDLVESIGRIRSTEEDFFVGVENVNDPARYHSVMRSREMVCTTSPSATVDALNLQNLLHREKTVANSHMYCLKSYFSKKTGTTTIPTPPLRLHCAQRCYRPMHRRDLVQRPGAVTMITVQQNKAPSDLPALVRPAAKIPCCAGHTIWKQTTISFQHTTVTRQARMGHSASTQQ